MKNLLIGAYASRFSGLGTRNARDFRRLFPDLTVAVPAWALTAAPPRPASRAGNAGRERPPKNRLRRPPP